MKALIIEDEHTAAENLKAIIKQEEPDMEIMDVLDSVQASVDYFQNNPLPDIIFMDIHLADGQSFLIFEKIELTCPVIFTTAYDEYALEAFKVNSIDYLLKPIEPNDVSKAIKKLKQLTHTDKDEYTQRIETFLSSRTNYTKTFLIPHKDKLIPIPTSQIAFFYTSNEAVSVTTTDGRTYPMDKSLDTLMTKLDPEAFYRANRQFIISHHAIKEVAIWFGNRLSAILVVPTQERIIISKARVSSFKKWLIQS
ncbi:LytR/AlgR family response regulator transcription factor [Carboxylicivirga linearis]|uniref:Response regulator transcription factor n=1 Tax=Carboxylicivirga linearis TaxID=1628157 RepID=A0ABS5JVG6_9BACT|nr:LytTR family DNA-binding domain-containing protein [Carboxylicivirga linearis]MBS2098894.1 response regulator transcription factor [Carboxylicivirga linearis]